MIIIEADLADSFTSTGENYNFPFGGSAKFSFGINCRVYIVVYFVNEIEWHLGVLAVGGRSVWVEIVSQVEVSRSGMDSRARRSLVVIDVSVNLRVLLIHVF
jgi:hypothetical protein